MLHTKYTRMAQIKTIFGAIAISVMGIGTMMLLFILTC